MWSCACIWGATDFVEDMLVELYLHFREQLKTCLLPRERAGAKEEGQGEGEGEGQGVGEEGAEACERAKQNCPIRRCQQARL